MKCFIITAMDREFRFYVKTMDEAIGAFFEDHRFYSGPWSVRYSAF